MPVNNISKPPHISAKTNANKSSMSGNRATSIDVARLAGVSQATVSRAFNPKSKMQDSTREKVLAAARTLKYSPDAIARSMTTNSSNIVGVIMQNSKSPFYIEALTRLSIRLWEHGKQMLFFYLDEPNKLQDLIRQIIQYRVDGIIVTSITMSANLADECANYGIPVVLLNRYSKNPNIHAVCADNIQAGRDCADYMFLKGYQNFAFVGNPNVASTASDRYLGFQTRLSERGIDDCAIYYYDYSYQAGGQAMDAIINDSQNQPQAVFCSNDVIAAGLMDTARYKYNLKIPEDLAVIGFDNTELSSYPTYDLTTFSQNLDEMLEETIQMIFKRNESANTTNLTLFPCRMIVRKSC